MPAKTGLFERPASIHSGPPLEQKVVVHHRSDLLLVQQIENVENVQDALQRTLLELEHCTDSEELEFHKSQAKDLRRRCDEMVLVLKIVQKINSELAYARSELKKSLKHGRDINNARKRVNWLEDRMERLLGKKSDKGPSRTGIKSATFHEPRYMLWQSESGDSVLKQEQDSIGDFQTSESVKSTDTSTQTQSLVEESDRYQIKSPETNVSKGTSSPPPIDGAGDRLPETAAQDEEPIPQKDVEEDGGIQQTAEGSPVAEDVSAPERRKKKKHKKKKKKDKKKAMEAADLGGISSVQYAEKEEVSEEKQPRSEEASPVPESGDKMSPVPELGDKMSPVPESGDKASPVSESGDNETYVSESQTGSITIGISITQHKIGDETEAERQTAETEDRSSSQSSTSSASGTSGSSSEGESSEEEDEEGDEVSSIKMGHGQTFLTETSILSHKSHKSKGSRVTILTPTEMEEYLSHQKEETGLSIKEYDAGMEYWNSEHHRFAFSEHTPLLLDINPLSYHQMGLAVPGSFVKQPCKRSTELPWRPIDTKREVSDVHKDALNKLAVKVHKMYSKVRDAALLSVNPSEQEQEISAKFMQNIDQPDEPPVERDTPETVQDKATMAKHGLNRPSSKDTITFPPLDKERLGSSMSGRLVYHPKPLPYPAKLPIPRTVRSKAYPRDPCTFSQSQAGVDPPAERMVDQRNLLQETKFSSTLYRSKPQAARAAQQSSDQRGRLLLQQDSRQEKRSRLRPAIAMVKAVGMFQGTKWNDMKPKSGALQHSGLKWERVKGLVHHNLISPSADERSDAARHLGLLKCGDSMVLYALRERLRHDAEERVVYEAAKSLVALGCWEEDVLDVLVHYLVNGNRSVRHDVLTTLSEGKNIQFVDKKMKAFPELAKMLSLLCMNKDPSDQVSFTAAICLGRLCVSDTNATRKLHGVLQKNTNTHIKAKALDILIRQLHQYEWDVVSAVLDQLQSSAVWSYRKDAAKLLIHLGPKHVLVPPHSDHVFDVLQRRLWDDPIKEVRLQVAKSLAALDLFPTACQKVEKTLQDQLEEVRAQAVVSVGTLGMKSERILRQLLEMLELDASEYVRLMVIRTFAVLGSADKRVIRALRDKERGEGPLGREAKKSLDSLGAQPSTQPTTKSTVRTK